MRTILAAALGLSLQAASLDEFYRFKVDTAWTYTRLEKGAERKVTARVTREEAEKVILDWRELEKDGTLRESTDVTWSMVEGVLTVEARSRNQDGEEHVLSFGLLKAGSKKDDRWTAGEGEYVHKGTLEVIVPAGTYKDAVWVRLELKEGGKVDFYLVPKVGLVKIEIHEPDGGDNRFELAEFKEGKK